MARLHRQPICVASALLVPLLVLGSPQWISIDGVGPAWALLWLLPWALTDGPISGAFAGLALGLILDGCHTQNKRRSAHRQVSLLSVCSTQ